MTLRCRPGDLAIVVRSRSERTWGIGRIVRVVELAPPEMFPDGPSWLMAEPIIGPRGERYNYVLDWSLRPIRPDSDPRATDLPLFTEVA